MKYWVGLPLLALLVLAGCVGPTPPSGGEVEIEGAWNGTYTGAAGTGRWAFYIEKVGPNQYRGWLTTTGPYAASNIPVTIALNGNKITVGWAGGATFEGTVQGDRMSGTWRTPNGDQGTWEGQRGEADITPQPGGQAQESQGGQGQASQETQETEGQEMEEQETGGQGASVPTQGICAEAYQEAVYILSGTGVSYVGIIQGGTGEGGEGCLLLFKAPASAQPDVQGMMQRLQTRGYTNVQQQSTEDLLIVGGSKGEDTALIITWTWSETEANVMVAYGKGVQSLG